MGTDLRAKLEGQLNYAVEFVPQGAAEKDPARVQTGLALLWDTSKWMIEPGGNVEPQDLYPDGSLTGLKGTCGLVRLQHISSSKKIRLIGVHLLTKSKNKTATNIRETQLVHLRDLLAQEDIPTIVTGDFNSIIRLLPGEKGDPKLNTEKAVEMPADVSQNDACGKCAAELYQPNCPGVTAPVLLGFSQANLYQQDCSAPGGDRLYVLQLSGHGLRDDIRWPLDTP